MKGLRETDPDTLMFFEGHRNVLELYLAFEDMLYASFPDISKHVRKTQISFGFRHVFACISFARVKRKADLPIDYMVLTLGLPFPLDSERAAVRVEPYPGRWTHHIVISRQEELDGELHSWVLMAYDFANRK